MPGARRVLMYVNRPCPATPNLIARHARAAPDTFLSVRFRGVSGDACAPPGPTAEEPNHARRKIEHSPRRDLHCRMQRA
ncbi:protein of unknown function [Burkholderia multivorans]